VPIAWAIAAIGGMAALVDYGAAPGEAGAPASHWPEGSVLHREPGRPTLVLAIHPKCPCTRATLSELAVLMARAEGRLKAHAILVRPETMDEDWAKSDLWRAARAIPGVEARIDPDGTEARRFGAATSGMALYYDADGKLRFAGGITAARGHAGDNAGRASIEGLAWGRGADRATTPVFGCSLSAEFCPAATPEG
jgi:hypothetical protein